MPGTPSITDLISMLEQQLDAQSASNKATQAENLALRQQVDALKAQAARTAQEAQLAQEKAAKLAAEKKQREQQLAKEKAAAVAQATKLAEEKRQREAQIAKEKAALEAKKKQEAELREKEQARAEARKVYDKKNDTEGKTPLHYAVIERKAAEVDKMLREGATPTITDGYRRDAFEYAVQSHDKEVLKAFLDNGYKLDKKHVTYFFDAKREDSVRRTCFHCTTGTASLARYQASQQFLRERGYGP